MTSLRQRIGQQIAFIPEPSTLITCDLDLHPPRVLDSDALLQASKESGLDLTCVVSRDILSQLLNFRYPSLVGGKIQTSLPLTQPVLLPPLSVATVAETQLPLVIQQTYFALLSAYLGISDNLFKLFATIRVMGMNYRDRIWREIPLYESDEQVSQKKKNGTQPLSKSYIDPRQQKGRKAKPRAPSFWDLLYVILQPPLVFEQIENLYLPHDLYRYQPAGIEFLMNNESALLADEMGTGKTVMTSVALRILMQKGLANHALIICPLSVLREWNRHLAEWAPDLRVTFVRGNKSTRTLDWNMPAHVYVTTYDTLRSDIDSGTLPLGSLSKFDVVVLDEAQNIKNPTSGRSRAIKQLKARQRWALTGTPIENKVEDVASLFEFLRPAFLTSFDLYPTRIKERIAPYFLRRRKIDVLPDLPSMQKQDIWLELDADQRVAYEQVEKEARIELTALGEKVSKLAIFAKINKLKQICNFAPGQFTSPKVDHLKQQIEEIIGSDQKVIVFSQYIGEGVNKLEEILEPYGIAKIVGGQSEAVRNAEIERFKKLPDTRILLASVRAGGVGLNLTEASYVAHFDHWWNPAVMWQAEARVHRPGQTRGVNVYAYWMQDTVEDRIYKTLNDKGLLFENVIDGLSETQIDELISADEWLDMLGVKRQKETQPGLKRETFETLGLTEIREKLYEITPSRFEHLVKELMRSLGYPNVKVTGRKGDGGIDVISTRNTSEGVVRVVAQCKRYRGTIGVEVARELRGAMTADENIQKGFLVTTSDFTSECIRFCERSGVITPISGLQVANYVKQFGLVV